MARTEKTVGIKRCNWCGKRIVRNLLEMRERPGEDVQRLWASVRQYRCHPCGPALPPRIIMLVQPRGRSFFSGKVIYVDFTFTDPNEIPSGARYPFKMTLGSDERSSKVTRSALTAESENSVLRRIVAEATR